LNDKQNTIFSRCELSDENFGFGIMTAVIGCLVGNISGIIPTSSRSNLAEPIRSRSRTTGHHHEKGGTEKYSK